mmetsp:Transcript_30785/g.50914  ORF Transcript_30785/g.50914 Transcript_30785/m.50914 type:complete len:97 (-) Transcript_30785:115-405(-)
MQRVRASSPIAWHCCSSALLLLGPAESGNQADVELALQRGAPVNFNQMGPTALQLAFKMGRAICRSPKSYVKQALTVTSLINLALVGRGLRSCVPC